MNHFLVVPFLCAPLLSAGATPRIAKAFKSYSLSPLVHPSSFIPHPFPVHPSSPILHPFEKYVGRYQLDVGIIPISTLDVSMINNELWVKPSVVKKRRLIHKSRTIFVDEIEGTQLVFNQDEGGKVVSVEFEYEGEKYTAQKITLPPPSLKGNVTFHLKGYADASTVVLTGSFNDWNQSQHVFGRQGDGWICRIDLAPGKYAYKFIVDGDWLLDPENPNKEDDDYGIKNSVIVVPKVSGQNRQP